MNKRTGTAGDSTWIPTFTGQKFDVFAPSKRAIRMSDIGHALAMKARWGGHAREFHSVAHHSVLVSKLLPPELALWGLLHDCGEAYLPDMQRPIKGEFPRFSEMEDQILKIVIRSHDLPWPMPPRVIFADDVVTAWEWRDLLTKEAKRLWEPERHDSIPVETLQAIDWREAETMWVERYLALNEKRKQNAGRRPSTKF